MPFPYFQVGDPLPDFKCATAHNPHFSFGSTAGRYIVLSFLGDAAHPLAAEWVDIVTHQLRPLFDDQQYCFFGVTINPADAETWKPQVPGIRFFQDFDQQLSQLYGALRGPCTLQEARAAYQRFTLVIDPALRLLAVIPLNDQVQHHALLVPLLQQLPPADAHAQVPMHAPVLIVPRVFEPAFCRQLIGLYETHGGEASGAMVERDGLTVGKLDPTFKRRKDYVIHEEEVKLGMRQRLVRRLLPEIAKCFQFHVTRIERYIVACYDGESGGFFKPHRDNTTKGTAHRKFAVTLNLNAEEFEGGDLRFPEFGSRTYRAPTGGAVVFSCSLLHEATPVTRGLRYATLPFLYNDEGARIRAENSEFVRE